MDRELLGQVTTVNEGRILVLGLGNILFQDEGLGVRAAEQLRDNFILPETVSCMDGGTLGLDLLSYFTADIRMLIFDAVRTGHAPGTLVRLEGNEIPAALAQKMSMHQLGLQDLMAASILRGTLPQKVVLLGMQPDTIDWGTELSPAITQAMPALIQSAIKELSDWGVAL